MATVTVSVLRRHVVGDREEVVADITLTGSNVVAGQQPSGGFASALGLNGISKFDLHGPAAVTGGVVGASYDAAADKILLYGNWESSAVDKKSPPITAVAIPGGPAVVRATIQGKGPGDF